MADPRLTSAIDSLGRNLVKEHVRTALARCRAGEIASDDVISRILTNLPEAATSLRRVINATGVIVHTNLGRAPLSEAAKTAVAAAAGSTDVELDLITGRRSKRGAGAIVALEKAIAGAGAAHVVNNGAAAIILACSAMAPGGNILLSRGEMVEIGDSFRIPELIEATGVEIREVGTTNRTHLQDYTSAIDANTGFALKIHPSNFTVEGFTSGVGIKELARNLPVPIVADIGSGLLTAHPRLPAEPDATTALRDGAALVIASGDKLLGGPQCGLLLGQPVLIEALRKHPLARALRVDKLTLAALEATLLGPPPPVARALSGTREKLRKRAEILARQLDIPEIRVIDSDAAVGGGGAPGVYLDSAALALPVSLARSLRSGRHPVVGRVAGGELLIDLIAVDPADDDVLIQAITAVWEAR